MKLLISCSTVKNGEHHDYLVQKWCINFLIESVIILMWDETEFGICDEDCHDAFVHHLIVLMSPYFLVHFSDEPITFNLEFFWTKLTILLNDELHQIYEQQ